MNFDTVATCNCAIFYSNSNVQFAWHRFEPIMLFKCFKIFPIMFQLCSFMPNYICSISCTTYQNRRWHHFNLAKAVAVSKHNSNIPEMMLFKFGGLKMLHQTAKLNTPPIILRIQ